MAMEPATGAVLRQMLNLSRNQPVNFAFCPEGKGGPMLLMDRNKPPEALAREIRAAGSGGRTACGSLTSHGPEIHLACGRDLPRLAVSLRRFFRDNGISAEIRVAAAEPDAGTVPEPAADTAISSSPGFDRLRRDWAEARNAAAADLKELIENVARATTDEPGYAHAARDIARLARPLAGIDGTLEGLMRRLDSADEPLTRQKLSEAAGQVITAHLETLDGGFAREIDQNGFVDTSIRETLRRPLHRLRDALESPGG